jgi:flagellar hook-associated protein 2
MRITGFSGMDIDSMVSQLMMAKRAPINRLNQQKTILEWTRNSYREINSKIVDFKDNKLKAFNLSSAMNTQQSVVTGNTTAVKADATANANSVPMSIVVESLASKSYMQSTALKTPAVGATPAGDAKLSTTLGELAGNIVPSTYDFTINGKGITFTQDQTIASVINKINTLPDAKVTASFDEISGKFSITAKEFGVVNDITGGTGTFATLLNIGTVNTAKQAKVIITNTSDLTTKTFNTDSNSLTVNGVNLSLLATNVGDPAKVTTQSAPSKALDTIKGFVESYNDLISTLGAKVNEERYKNYQPLTNEEKNEMKDSDVIAWEAKSKSGLLKNDEILKSAISSMRAAILEHVGDLSSVGITTGKYHEGGKLYIDEEKLKLALQNDPSKVTDLFKGTTDGTTKGIFEKVGNTMDVTLTKMVTKAGTSKYSTDINSIYREDSVMGRNLKSYNKQISNLESRLTAMENRYYKQFTAMETAMSKYESQSSSLAGYFQ